MSLLSFGSVSSSNRGDNWALTDDSGSYTTQSILKIPSGGYYIFYSYSRKLSKFDNDGNRIWEKSVDFGSDVYFQKLLSNGDILFVGTIQAFNNKASYGRFNPESGTFLWIKDFIMGYQIELWTTRIAVDATETHAYLYFTRKISGDPNTAPTYPTLSKFNLSNGSISWTKEIVAPGGYRAFTGGVVADTSGNVYVCGSYFISADSEFRAFLVKYNSSGTVQWQKTFARTNTGQYTDYLQLDEIALDSAGNVHVAGIYRYAGSPTFGTPGYYAKVDSSGNLLNQQGILPNPVPAIEFPINLYSAWVLTVDENNDAYMLLYGQGFDRSISTQTGTTLVKISNGTTLDFVYNLYFGTSLSAGFAGPSGLLSDDTIDKILVSLYSFTGGPETVVFSIPRNGVGSGVAAKPNLLLANVRTITPGQIITPPATMSSGAMTLRDVTESYTFETPTTPTVSTAQSTRYIKRF